MFPRMRFARYFLVYRTRFTLYASNFTRNLHRYGVILRRPQTFMLALTSAGFSFHNSGVSDEEFAKGKSNASTDSNVSFTDNSEMWEDFRKEGNLQVFRRVRKDKNGKDLPLYEFKVVGSYDDISANHFVEAQIDDNYRGQWDENVIALEVIEKDLETDSQVIRWLANYPYPLNPRLYIFVRRKIVDVNNQRITVVCESLGTKSYPDDDKYVRVTSYKSKLGVSAHTTLDKPGLDFTLVYYDDPKTSIPSFAQKFIMNYSGPDFVRKIHEAAKELAAHRIKEETSNVS